MVFSARPAGSRLRFAASPAIVLASLMALAAFAANGALADDSSNTDVAKTISQEVAKFNITPRTIELTSEKAVRVRNAIKDGDYATARQIAATVQAESHVQNWRYYPFDAFISRISDRRDPQFEQRLDDWVMQDKDDAIPLLIRARYYYDMGWFTRGEKFASETAGGKMASFEDYMVKGLADVNDSMHLDDSNPYATFLRLLLMRGFGMSPPTESMFEEGIGRIPDYYAPYGIMLTLLEPKWGGSTDAMYAFVDKYAGHASDYSPLRLLYLALYGDLLSTAALDCREYWQDRDKAAQCVDTGMKDMIRPELKGEVVSALALYDHTDRSQFAAKVKSILFDMLGWSGTDAYSYAVLEMAANGMHSDARPAEDSASHNNYAIDQAVAEFWYRKAFYDNALEKDREALQDVRLAQFSNEEERLLETGSIYDHMAHIYQLIERYPDMIAYETAAVALSGDSADGLLICAGDYELKDYVGAIRECPKVFNDYGNGLSAQYWRGLAYEHVDQTDAALADLGVVADSEHESRSSAAIEMSMIHFKRHDWQGGLNLLNKYSFLYDPRVTNRSDVAAAYNNRCNAYMQLGELQKALDDCTQSLKFDSIPDAYRKQQDLIKRLSEHKNSL